MPWEGETLTVDEEDCRVMCGDRFGFAAMESPPI